MNKFFYFLFLVAFLTSCEDSVTFNNPSMQGKLDNVFWRADAVTGSVNGSGIVTIHGVTLKETIDLKFPLPTNNQGTATFTLGTTNQNIFASVLKRFETDIEVPYATSTILGPVATISTPINGGTGYTATGGAETIGGNGTGLKVRTTVVEGVITQVEVVFSGTGYKAGNVITIVGGGNNAKFRVINVEGSNGQIKISEYNSLEGTITGSFRFNAKNVEDNPIGESTLNFQEGVFYKIKLYTAP